MLKSIVRRLAAIPLGVYALGVPTELYLRGNVSLSADGLLPFEVLGLAGCVALVVLL